MSGFRLRNDRDTRPVRLADTNLVADPVIVTSTELDLTGPARRTDHTDLPGLPDAGGPPSADGGDTARPGPVLPVLPSLTTRPLLPLPLALPLPAPVTDGPVPGGPAAAAPGDGSGSEASGTGTPQDDTAHHRRPRTAPAPLPTAGLSGDRSAPAAHAAPPAPLRQDPQNPAGEPDGTLGHRAATDGGTSRCGDALALTGPHRPPLVLAPGAAARADADGTRDRYRDVPVSPA